MAALDVVVFTFSQLNPLRYSGMLDWFGVWILRVCLVEMVLSPIVTILGVANDAEQLFQILS